MQRVVLQGRGGGEDEDTAEPGELLQGGGLGGGEIHHWVAPDKSLTAYPSQGGVF